MKRIKKILISIWKTLEEIQMARAKSIVRNGNIRRWE